VDGARYANGLFAVVSIAALWSGWSGVAWPQPGRMATEHAWRIDLESAGVPELRLLPGVGPVRSRAIIGHRASHRIRCVQDLMNIPGIGSGTVARLHASGLLRR